MPFCFDLNRNSDTIQWVCSSSIKEFEDFILNEDLIKDFTIVHKLSHDLNPDLEFNIIISELEMIQKEWTRRGQRDMNFEL